MSGTVGCLGAMEVIKWITNIGEPLAGSLLTMDLRDMAFDRIAVKRNPYCQVCGQRK